MDLHEVKSGFYRKENGPTSYVDFDIESTIKIIKRVRNLYIPKLGLQACKDGVLAAQKFWPREEPLILHDLWDFCKDRDTDYNFKIARMEAIETGFNLLNTQDQQRVLAILSGVYSGPYPSEILKDEELFPLGKDK